MKNFKKLTIIIAKLSLILAIVFLFQSYLYSILRDGYVKYFGIDCLNNFSDVIFIGHSHSMHAFDRKQMSSMTNMSMSGFTLFGIGTEVREIIVKSGLTDNAKVIVYDVDTEFSSRNESEWKQLYQFMDIKHIDSYLKSKDKELYYTKKIIQMQRFGQADIAKALKGSASRSYIDEKKSINYQGGYVNKNQNIENNKWQKNIINTINLLKKGQVIIFVYLPETDFYSNIKDKLIVRNFFEYLVKNNDNVFFVDYSNEFDNNLNYFYNEGHVNNKGKDKISELFSSYLLNIMSIDHRN